jgi:hypothetical protein
MSRFFVVKLRIDGEFSLQIIRARTRAEAKSKIPEGAEIISIEESK